MVIDGSQELNENHSVIISDDGWLSPEGKFYSCNPDEHEKLANELCAENPDKIKELLRINSEDETLSDLERLNPRTILGRAGFALLSNGLLMESNMPGNPTKELQRLIEENNLIVTPEAGKLLPKYYAEYKKVLQQIDFDDIMAELSYSSEFNPWELSEFIKNPSHDIDLADAEEGARILFDLLTNDYDGEIIAINEVARDRFVFRRIILTSGEIFLFHQHHSHYESDPDYNAETQDFISITDKNRLKKFIQELKMNRTSNVKITGDINILE